MDLRPTCTHCKCAMDMANIRANPEGSGFICRTCLDAKMGNKGSSSRVSTTKEPEIFAKKSYLCEDCGFTFERNATFIVVDCPMCAKPTVHEMFVENKDTSKVEAQSNKVTDESEWMYE